MLTNERCFCCYQSQNYKIWKQFTTYEPHRATCNKLLSITKLQNLKAIHNSVERHLKIYLVVINHKTTKFESNSQRVLFKILLVTSCYQSQNYEIWKQFTTHRADIDKRLALLSITKLQNLKAIHNSGNHCQIHSLVVINHKTTKFESNSQRSHTLYGLARSCYQSQNYKIWKQFTTCYSSTLILIELLSITKLQNLKAIHNVLKPDSWPLKVVINHKTTKFESNSQPSRCTAPYSQSCYQSQNYKIWKQFTTRNGRIYSFR